jgi:hypothetical protein
VIGIVLSADWSSILRSPFPQLLNASSSPCRKLTGGPPGGRPITIPEIGFVPSTLYTPSHCSLPAPRPDAAIGFVPSSASYLPPSARPVLANRPKTPCLCKTSHGKPPFNPARPRIPHVIL